MITKLMIDSGCLGHVIIPTDKRIKHQGSGSNEVALQHRGMKVSCVWCVVTWRRTVADEFDTNHV